MIESAVGKMAEPKSSARASAMRPWNYVSRNCDRFIRMMIILQSSGGASHFELAHADAENSLAIFAGE